MKMIDKEILNVRKLMVKIKNSVLLCDDLRELCIMKKLEYLRPEIDIETRWNSTYYMLCKLLRMETALKILAIKHGSVRNLMPNADAWTKIKVFFYCYISIFFLNFLIKEILFINLILYKKQLYK